MPGSRSQLLSMHISPPHKLLLNGDTFYSTPQLRYSPIVPPFIGGYQFLRQVDNITKIVYKRLLRGPDMQRFGRVNTLPDGSNDIAPVMPLDQMQSRNLPPSRFHSSERQSKSEEERIRFQETSANYNTQQSLADDIDEYLTSMNLDKLSQAERVHVEQNDQLDPYIPPSGAMRQVTRPEISGPPNVTDSLQRNQLQSGSPHEPCSRDDTNTRTFSRLDPLSVSAGIIRFYGLAAAFSLDLSNIFRDTNGECKEVRLLSQRLGQYSELLQSACGVMTTMSFSEELRGVGTSILYDNERLTKELKALLSCAQISRYRLMRKFTWNLLKRDIMGMVEQIDFLKSSLSLILQLYQVKMTEGQTQMSRQSSPGQNLP